MFSASPLYHYLIWPVLVMAFIISGCSHTSELFRDADVQDKESADYSVIYYIHADSDYLYHTTAGEPVRGNLQVLDDAFQVAENAASGEVFIFYQRPERKLLGLFPRKSSHLYHYRNGERITRVNYRHSDKNEDFLTTEARLYQYYKDQSPSETQEKYFLYFGHEIPATEGEKYHRTLPDIDVNTMTFSAGIQKFLGSEEQRFHLVALSTCNNGTPAMADHLMPFTNVLLASPHNLHLSHLDSKGLMMLENSPGVSSIELAQAMAENTYKRLEAEVQTEITLAVYDLEILQESRSELQTFITSYDAMGRIQHFSVNIDCKQSAFFDEDLFEEGVKTWYRPARFGRQSGNSTHSGWGCKPIAEN